VSAKLIVSIAGTARSFESLSLIEVKLIAAHEAAAQGNSILAPSAPPLLALVPHDPETIVTVFDLAETARELDRDGIFRYSWARARSMGFLTLARLLPIGFRLVPQLRGLGIAGLGLMLAAAELRHVADRGFRAVALHWQLSDFLVATGDSGWLYRYIGLARSYGLRAGMCSHDVRRALQLAEQLSGLDFVIAPLSAAGFRMTPDREGCEAVIKRRRVDVLPHLGSLNTIDPKDCAYAESLGLTRFVVDF
jgi:hypothetical protein